MRGQGKLLLRCFSRCRLTLSRYMFLLFGVLLLFSAIVIVLSKIERLGVFILASNCFAVRQTPSVLVLNAGHIGRQSSLLIKMSN